MQYKVMKRFMDGPRFGSDKAKLYDVGDFVEAGGMRSMRLAAYGIIMLTGAKIENAMSGSGEKRGRGRPRKS